MSDIENRIKKLEKHTGDTEGYRPKQRTVEEMSSDELAELVTGVPGTKFDDLTDEYLQALARGEHPTLL